MLEFELSYEVYIAWYIVDVMLVKFTKIFIFDNIMPFSN